MDDIRVTQVWARMAPGSGDPCIHDVAAIGIGGEQERVAVSGVQETGQPFAGGRQAQRVGQLSALPGSRDRKSTRLNSSHVSISYAVFCLKKKKETENGTNGTYKQKTSRWQAAVTWMQVDG